MDKGGKTRSYCADCKYGYEQSSTGGIHMPVLPRSKAEERGRDGQDAEVAVLPFGIGTKHLHAGQRRNHGDEIPSPKLGLPLPERDEQSYQEAGEIEENET